MKKYLTIPQIAKFEEVSRATIERWIQKGAFPGTRKVGRAYKIPIESYNIWRESTHVKPNQK